MDITKLAQHIANNVYLHLASRLLRAKENLKKKIEINNFSLEQKILKIVLTYL
jgi:hypothetical protein